MGLRLPDQGYILRLHARRILRCNPQNCKGLTKNIRLQPNVENGTASRCRSAIQPRILQAPLNASILAACLADGIVRKDEI